MKHFWLTRGKEFVECEIVKSTPRKRSVKITEVGHALEGKTIHTAPEGVAKGNLYPRVFSLDAKPTEIFEMDGRVMVKDTASDGLLVPVATSYNFQPVTRSVMDSILSKDKVLLTGEAGTGKTSMVEQIAARINQKVLRVNLNGETRMSDFVGRNSVINDNGTSITQWIDGILPTAMKNGYWLILDELDFAQPEILSLLHPVLEPNGKLVIKENKGEEVSPHTEFRIFGTANSVGSMSGKMDSYTGTNQMNAAFMDRWHVLTVPHLAEKDEVRVVRDRVPHLAPRYAKRLVQFANTLRRSENNVVPITLSTRTVLAWAEKTALYNGNAIKGAENVFLNKVTPTDKDVLVKQIELHVGKKGSKVKNKAKGTPVVIDPNAPKRKRGRPRKNPLP